MPFSCGFELCVASIFGIWYLVFQNLIVLIKLFFACYFVILLVRFSVVLFVSKFVSHQSRASRTWLLVVRYADQRGARASGWRQVQAVV